MDLSPIFTTLDILANTDTVDMSHDFGCHGSRTLGVTMVTKIGILLKWWSGAEYRSMVYGVFLYLVY